MINSLRVETGEIAVTARGIDAPLALRRTLAAAHTKLLLLERTAHVGTFDLELASGTWTWSDELCRILGLSTGSTIDGTSYMKRVHPDDAQMMQELLAALRDGVPFTKEHRIVLDDATERWVETSAQAVLDDRGSVVRLFGTCTDITARKCAELQLVYLGRHDALTGLPNRNLLAEQLTARIAAAGPAGRQIALIYAGLDDFKQINEAYGRDQGDRVIARCAECLTSCTRSQDVVARVGGDEFVVVMGDLESGAAAAAAVQRIRTALAERFAVGSATVGLQASFGISCYPADGQSADQLIGYADLAMHRAKETRRGDLVYFEPALRYAAAKRRRHEHELGDAIRNGDLAVHYQPIIDARTKRIGGVEALIRWPHPTQGLKLPGSFIPLAEETGLIVPLGDFVLREAMREVAELQRSASAKLRLSVNLSARQLEDEGLAETVRAALAASGMAAEQLDLEITETFLISDPQRAASRLAELVRLGIRIALDDFGTGYSSLTFLRQFPVHLLKLDRSFVSEIEHSEISRTIASAVIDLARKLGLNSVAEGVETAEQHHILAELGCDAFQGFYFARPMPIGALEDYVMSETSS